MIRSDSIVGPFLVFAALFLALFFGGISAEGGKTCVSKGRIEQNIPLNAVNSFTWMREDSVGRIAAFTFQGTDREMTAICHFKEDTYVILNIEYLPGDQLSNVHSISSLVLF